MSHSKENTKGSEHAGNKTGLAGTQAGLGKSPVPLDRLIDFLPDPTFAIDTSGTVILWNKALEDIWGVRAQDMLGKGNYEYAIPFYGHRRPMLANMVLGDGTDMKRKYTSLTCRGDSILAEGYTQTPQGTIYVMAKASPIYDSAGTVIGVIETIRDITERVNYEERLARAQKLEAIGTLAGGIAHDFNNILSAVIGYTELAIDDVPPGDPVARSLQEVLKAGDRAKDLVSQILTFSRQVRTEKKVVRVHFIVKEAMKLLRSSIPSTIAITRDIDPHSPAVFADPTQIHQMVMNLCTNAYQAMMARGGTLTVGLAPVELDTALARGIPRLEPGTYLHLWVRDTGCGMDQETVDRVFEPFFTTREKGNGTGLGLSTVHGIVSDLSGAVTVSSTMGEGSTFHVYLPACKPVDRKDQIGEDTVPRGNGERILLVDDESAILAFAESMIEQMGYSVSTHSSSVQALDVFSRDPHAFDLVITDQTMPLLTGADLAAKMRAIRNDIPIILITGFSEIVSAEQARKQGISVYLEKPFTRKSLASAICRALGAS